MSQLEEESCIIFFFQYDGASPQFHCNVTHFLKNHLPGRWTGRGGPNSLHLIPLGFFPFRWCVKESFYTPQCPKISVNSKLALKVLVNQLTCKCFPVFARRLVAILTGVEYKWGSHWNRIIIKTLTFLVYSLEILLPCIALSCLNNSFNIWK